MLQNFLNKLTFPYKVIEENQRRRVAYWQLKNLSDHDLKDIGLNRCDIYRVAYKDPIE